MSCLKLEIYIPESHFPALQAALREADAGHIGNYDSCLSVIRVTSTWRPMPGSNPFNGETGKLSTEEELKVEVTIREKQLEHVMRVIRDVHPYEEPVVNVIPLYCTMQDFISSKESP